MKYPAFFIKIMSKIIWKPVDELLDEVASLTQEERFLANEITKTTNNEHDYESNSTKHRGEGFSKGLAR